ncbi:potassium/proton antiporter [Janibacter sp. GXQ6167]|uniref:potassium/proton antiporter n=1 Tax=Janibacter sp. GXQ6167 TaxID=3240791 RepID=UPI003524BD26
MPVADSVYFTPDELPSLLLISAAVLVVCVAAVRLTARSGLPALLLYLAVGLMIGEAGLGIEFDSANLAQILGYSALVLILTEGGLTTRWSSIRGSVIPAFALSTVGVLVSVAVVGTVLAVGLGMDWGLALLVGAILSSTDAAAVFSVLRRVPLPRRLTGMLEAESGFNDAPVVILVVTLSTRLADPSHSEPWWQLGISAAWELTAGAVIGMIVGYLGGRLIRGTAIGSSGLFAIGVIAVSVLAYGAAATLGTSGFIACYVASLVLGNMRLPHRAAVSGFAEAVGWLAQIGLFVMLGLVVSPSGFLEQVPLAILLGLVLLLLARPLSVIVSLTPFRIGWRDQAFLSWAGLRGAVPIVLATVPITTQASDTDWILDLVFVLVVAFTLLQAPTLPFMARVLGVTESGHATDLGVESVPLEALGADLLDVQVSDESRLHGVEIFELRLPKGSNVTLIVRDGSSFVPSPRTPLRAGDQMLIVTTAEARDKVERRIRSVSRYGRLAGWAKGRTGR